MWITDIKGENRGAGKRCSWEISVVRSDNEHGLKSYGWFDSHSKLLIGHDGGPCCEGVHPFVWDRLIETANQLRNMLNKEEIE